jgi:hypothetical protein
MKIRGDEDGFGRREAFAVGTLIAERPPHRSEQARFRHSAPLFLALTVVFSTICYALNIRASHLHIDGSNYVVGLPRIWCI